MHKLIAGAALAAAAALAVAQPKYPQKTIEVVVPYAPGGGTDNLMRMITGIIDENKWSPVPMNVNNRAGGSGAVGYNYLINKKGDAHNLAVAAKKRLADAPEVPTFAERGYEFYWEQMRGVVGPAKMAPEAVKWWQDTLRKVTETKKWKEDYIKRNLLTPTQWTGEEANKYLDSLQEKYAAALNALGAIKK